MAMPRIEEELTKINQPYKLNKADYKIHVEGKGDIIFRSMERPERIVAYETGDCVVDELDTLKPDKAEFVYRKITERTRARKHDGRPNTVAVVTTPDNGISGFVYKLYGKPKSDEFHLIKASTYDNPFLPPEYIEQIKSNYDEALAELYLNGEFVSLTHNKVYHYFDRKRHHSDRTIQPNDVLHIGIDFNIGACASVVYVRDQDKLIAVDEFVSYDTREMIINIQRYKNRVMLYPDASGYARSTNASQSDIAMLKEAGLQINAPAANGAVRDRVNATNNLLSKDRLLVNTTKCPQYTFSLESQGYDDKGEPEKFKDHKDGSIDDWNDAGTYPCARIYPVQRTGFTTSTYY